MSNNIGIFPTQSNGDKIQRLNYWVLDREKSHSMMQMSTFNSRNILCDIIPMYVWTYIRSRDICLHTMWQFFMCIHRLSSNSETFFMWIYNIKFRDISLYIYGQTFASFIFVSFSDLFEIIVFFLCIYHAHSTSHNIFQIILKLSSRKLTGVGRGCRIVILAPKINC